MSFDHKRWFEEHSAAFTTQLKGFMDDALKAGDAKEIANTLFLITANAEMMIGTILIDSLEAIKNLPPDLRRQVAEAIEVDVLRGIKNIAVEEKEEPMRSKTPESIRTYNDSTSNRGIVESQNLVLLLVAEVKKNDVQPLTKAYLAEAAQLSPSDPLYVTGFYEAALRALNKVEGVSQASTPKKTGQAPKGPTR